MDNLEKRREEQPIIKWNQPIMVGVLSIHEALWFADKALLVTVAVSEILVSHGWQN